ncbi:MAG: class I SAM-dependent methyltransferase [Nanoarchaeota archaeon]|mgnify:CR=1 FL=1
MAAVKGGRFERFLQINLLRPLRLKAILKILNKLPSGTILDVGCMDDYMLKKIPKRFEYIGFDEEPSCKNDKIIKGRVEDYIGNKKFDIVICTEVLEHLDNPVEAIKKLKSWSKRFIIISVPNEPFFSLFRFFLPAKEHLWTIFPWALKKHLGRPLYETKACFNRTYIALWNIENSEKF